MPMYVPQPTRAPPGRSCRRTPFYTNDFTRVHVRTQRNRPSLAPLSGRHCQRSLPPPNPSLVPPHCRRAAISHQQFHPSAHPNPTIPPEPRQRTLETARTNSSSGTNEPDLPPISCNLPSLQLLPEPDSSPTQAPAPTPPVPSPSALAPLGLPARRGTWSTIRGSTPKSLPSRQSCPRPGEGTDRMNPSTGWSRHSHARTEAGPRASYGPG